MNRFKELRLKNGKTQLQISKLLNISQVAYSKYENNKAEPDIQSLKILAEYYGVSIDYLIENKNDETKKDLTQLSPNIKLIADALQNSKIELLKDNQLESIIAVINTLIDNMNNQ